MIDRIEPFGMRRAALSVAFVLALAGCQPPVPDSGAAIGGGVGFGDYAGYQAPAPTVPATVRPPAPTAGPAVSARTAAPVAAAPIAAPATASEPQAIAAATVAALGAGSAPAAPPAPAAVAPAPAPIASAPARVASGGGHTVAAFALATSHAIGTPVYSRTGLSGDGRAARACARFAADAFAQEEFLRRGGPDRDPMGVDPDGDGYACGWDPAPFRQLGN